MAPPYRMTVTMYDSAMASAKGEVQALPGTGFSDVAGDEGRGTLLVAPDDPYLVGGATVERGDVALFTIASTPPTPAWAMIVTDAELDDIGPGGPSQRLWRLTGPGTLGVWRNGVVGPPIGAGRALFSDHRVWNFASPELDDTAWASAVTTEAAHDGVNFGLVELFPDTQALWMWDRAVTGGIPSGAVAPSGDCYFRTHFTKTGAGNVELWAAADDSFEAWVDGVQVLTDPGYYRGNVSRAGPFRLDDGDHVIAVRGTNQNAAKAGVLLTIIEVDAAGLYGNVICRSDATWKVKAYPPTPPGFPATQILRILSDEWINQRGGGAGVGVSFLDATDTAGTTVEAFTEWAVPVGASIYTALRKLGEAYMDFRMRPAVLTLDGWVAGGAGTTLPSVQFDNATGDPAVDNLRRLTHELSHDFTVEAS